MNNDNDARRIALLEATLREMLRINREAEADTVGSMGMETSLDGQLLKQWRSIRRKAESLVGAP